MALQVRHGASEKIAKLSLSIHSRAYAEMEGRPPTDRSVASAQQGGTSATPRFGLSEERARGDAACFRNATGVKVKLATNSHEGVSATSALNRLATCCLYEPHHP
jgi:hypothetical protein